MWGRVDVGWLAGFALLACSPGSTNDATSSDATGSSGSHDTMTAPGADLCEDGFWGEDEGGGADDTGIGMGDDMPISVFAVQMGDAALDQRVALSEVVVVTPSAPSETYGGQEMFVQELAGGPYSGLRIQSSTVQLGTRLSPGDTAEIHGRVRSRDGFYLVEIQAEADIVVLGTADPPEPPVVAPQDLAFGTETARAYEGMIVRIELAEVTDPDPCDGEFILDDIVRVDDRFMPDAGPAPGLGSIVASVRGVVSYSSTSYELAPPDPGAITR